MKKTIASVPTANIPAKSDKLKTVSDLLVAFLSNDFQKQQPRTWKGENRSYFTYPEKWLSEKQSRWLYSLLVKEMEMQTSFATFTLSDNLIIGVAVKSNGFIAIEPTVFC